MVANETKGMKPIKNDIIVDFKGMKQWTLTGWSW
jgi:hypothetical protein